MNSIDQQLIKIATSASSVKEEVLDEKKKNKKKKPYDSMYIGNGNPAADVAFFNRTANSYLNGTIKAQSASTADTLAGISNIGVSPDGGNSVSLGGGDSAGASTGGACCEGLELEEAVNFDPAKIPTQIKLLDKNNVENFIDNLQPEEIFAVGYLNPVYLYKELWDYLPIYKCTEFLGFTGVDFSQTQDDRHTDQAKRIADATDQIKQAKETGKQVHVGAAVNYSSQNKLVNQGIFRGNTILFYPTAVTNIKYYVKFPNNPNEFVAITAEQLENYIYKNLDKIAKKVFDDPERAQKWRHKISTYFSKDAIEIDRDTRSTADLGTKFIQKYGLNKIAVRALYTDRIYYLEDGNKVLGKKLTEDFKEAIALKEFKRYVRRYYIKPQNIFCSNKNEILKALVDHNDEDCIIYTLNNLGDVKDVGKLTDSDIIYYYKDGILYDKNEVRVMDYNLSIKHEEDREKLNPNTVSDAKYKAVYDDRITELTDLEEALIDTFDVTVLDQFIGKEVKIKFKDWPEAKDGKIVSFEFDRDNGDLRVEVEIAGESAHKFLAVEIALKVGSLIFKDMEDQEAIEKIIKDNYEDPDARYERETKKENAIEFQNGKDAADRDFGTEDGLRIYNKYKKTAPGYNAYIDGYLTRWEELKFDKRKAKSAKTAEEKIDSQVEGGKEVTKYADETAEAWLMTHVTGIKFTLPDFHGLPDDAPKTLSARLYSTYKALERQFPGITSNPEHFELVHKGAEQEKAWYGKWGLNGTIKFTVEFSKFPESVRQMAHAAVDLSQAKNHDALPVKEDAKIIQNIYFCFAVLDLFDGNLDFYKLSDEDAATIAETNPFDQTFESLREADINDKCCICGEDIIGYGNNAEPYTSGRCCDACNLKFVIPARIDELKKSKGK